MQITNISDAKASLSALIREVQKTDEPIIIGKAGKPIAVLSAYHESAVPRKLGGSWEGNVTVIESNETDKEIKDTFYKSVLFPNQE